MTAGEEKKIKSIKDFFLKPPFPPLPKALVTGDMAPPILGAIYYGITALNHQINAMDQQINALDNLLKAVDKIWAMGGNAPKPGPLTRNKSPAGPAVVGASGELEHALTEFIKKPSDDLIGQIEKLRESTSSKVLRAYLGAIADAYKEGNKEEAVALASGVRRALRAIKNKP